MATHSLAGRHAPPGSAKPGEAEPAAERELAHFRAHGFTPAPRFVQWLATLRCELSCPHCLAAGRAMPDMPLAAVARLLDQVAAMGIPEFLVTGGEPAARPDLPEVVAMLRERGLRWSLNTAAAPPPRLRAAMERHPPAFVAVSLDGPEQVHDRFRGRAGAFRDALAAIRFYRGLVRGEVVAGTTVTQRNCAHLAETFAEVVTSGATAWGLHLLVPEGRARNARGLFLRRRQLRSLMDFCAARRNHFPVGMADEIGYLGEEEPLVRDAPFFCGAGRTQCVVLPDGGVVPCTTLDAGASAGNVLRRPLAEIWAEGFAALRRWQPEGRCQSCEYAPACRGGCWLQRRNGTQCFRAVWRAPKLLGAAAAAVCFGLGAVAAAGGEPAEPEKPPAGRIEEPFPDVPRGAAQAGTIPDITPGGFFPEDPKIEEERARKCAIEAEILGWYLHRYRRHMFPYFLELGEERAKEPAWVYFKDFIDPKRSRELPARYEAIKAGLLTGQPSLSLAALMWRDLAETCFDGKAATERSEEEREFLRKNLAAIDARSAEWRIVAFKDRLGSYMNRRFQWECFGYKDGGFRWESSIHRTVAKRRWDDWETVTRAYIAAHPFGEALDLDAACDQEAGLLLVRGGREEEVAAYFKLRIFDLIKTPEGKAVRFRLSNQGDEVTVKLPANAELAYVDVLRLAWEQNRKFLDAKAEELLATRARSIPAHRVLLLPAFHALDKTLVDETQKPENRSGGLASKLSVLRMFLDNLWLF